MYAISAHAGKIELAIMPGDVILEHAEFEEQCEKCHIRFDRDAQPGLCLDCHKPVAADVKTGQGYHGRLEATECKSCHTEHIGRDAQILTLDVDAFDHTRTDFLLVGKHEEAACTGCHELDKIYRDAPSECISCHRKDDEHEGRFGGRCQSCHDESGWKKLTFHHNTDTQFALSGRHRNVSCTDCHAGPLYQQNTPTRCHDCHSKDDAHKHSLGRVCKNCHTEKSWKDAPFDHKKETRFKLLYEHASVRCNSCHVPDSIPDKLPRTCFGCHEKDDQERGHQGRYGKLCDTCHDERAFKPSLFKHDLDTHYPLRHSHSKVKCDSCHTGSRINEKIGTTCYACHESDDMDKGHQGFYGNKCETCHIEKSFKDILFDHDRDTNYRLLDKHRLTDCRMCHQDPPWLVDTDTQCYACHKVDDVHFGTYDLRCDQCHTPNNWRSVKRT